MFLLRFPYYQQELHFSEGDRTGARVVERGLVEAALKLRFVEGVHIINDHLDPKENSRIVGLGIIEATSSWISSTVQSGADFVALVSLVDFPRFAVWRQHLLNPLPICAIVHAIPHDNLVPLYLAILALAQPYDRIVVSSEAGKDAVLSFAQQCGSILGNTPSRLLDELTVIPLPVEPPVCPDDSRANARCVFSITEDAIVFLLLGRITSAYKADLEPVIRAFGSIASSKTVLVIAGHEAEANYVLQLKNFITACGLSDNVKFILNIPSYSKHLVFALADVFIAPADNIQETFGLAVVEAMLAGLPVVATNWSGHRELVIDGETGILIDTWLDATDQSHLSMVAAASAGIAFEKAMSQRAVFDVSAMASALGLLINNKALRQSMGAAGRSRASKRFSSEAVIPSYHSLWETQILESKGHNMSAALSINFVSPFDGFARADNSLSTMRIASSSLHCISNDILDASEKENVLSGLGHQPISELLSEEEEQRTLLRRFLKKGILSLEVSPPAN